MAATNSFATLQPSYSLAMLAGDARTRTKLRKLHPRDEFHRRRARQSFAECLRRAKPDYQLSWFHEELAGALDSFLDDVLANEIPGLDAFAG